MGLMNDLMIEKRAIKQGEMEQKLPAESVTICFSNNRFCLEFLFHVSLFNSSLFNHKWMEKQISSGS
jgi:hypothetical protein